MKDFIKSIPKIGLLLCDYISVLCRKCNWGILGNKQINTTTTGAGYDMLVGVGYEYIDLCVVLNDTVYWAVRPWIVGKNNEEE